MTFPIYSADASVLEEYPWVAGSEIKINNFRRTYFLLFGSFF